MPSMPLYGCPDCGWATIASLVTAAHAHEVSSPACPGELELIDDWHFPRVRAEPPVARRRSDSQEPVAAAPDPA